MLYDSENDSCHSSLLSNSILVFLKFETIDEFSSLENGIFDESFGVNSNISRGQDHDW